MSSRWGDFFGGLEGRIKAFCNDLNTTSFGKVNTEILWYLTMPFTYLCAALLPAAIAEFTIGIWLGALCAKSGVEYKRYQTDRKTEFTPEQHAQAEVLRAQADQIRGSNTATSATPTSQVTSDPENKKPATGGDAE